MGTHTGVRRHRRARVVHGRFPRRSGEPGAPEAAAALIIPAATIVFELVEGNLREFIGRLVAWSGEQNPQWHLDYWRLNIIARRPQGKGTDPLP